MSYPGSVVRFIVGLIISAEVIREFLLGQALSEIVVILAGVYIALSALFFIAKF